MKEHLRGTVTYSSSFHRISSQIKEWNLERINGKSLFKSHRTSPGRYAHIELSIYENIDNPQMNYVVWKTNEKELPNQVGHKPFIEKVLSFFVGYISALKGKSIKLTFEINDGSYHPVDTMPRDFETAVTFALINCFDKNFRIMSQEDSTLIQKLKLEAIKNYSLHFDKNNP